MRNIEVVNGWMRPSNYIDALSLTGTTAETFTVPATAQYVKLAGTVAFYYLVTGSAGTPTAVAPADDANGTASAYVPIYETGLKLKVTPGDKISVVTAAGGIITAEYWRD